MNTLSKDDLATVAVGASCIFTAESKPFLLAEIDATSPGVEIDPIIIIRMTKEQFQSFKAAGFPLCDKVNRLPQPTAGLVVEFKCVFMHGDKAFLVFDVEHGGDRAVLVRVPLARAERLLEEGARQCTVIRTPFVDGPIIEDDSSGD